MKFIFICLVFLCPLLVFSQTQPVKWATQESFFEDLQGKDLPDFSGKTINNNLFKSSELKGKIVVINFWFEKCPPCLAEMPDLNKLVERYGADHVRFIGVTHDLPHQAKRFQKRNGYKYEIVSLSPEEIRKININHGFPSNILVGQDGKIIMAMANISFSDAMPEFKLKSILFEEKLKTEIQKSKVSN